MPGSTTRLSLPYPLAAESADGPAGIQNLATAIDSATIFASGTFASRPAAALAGKIYYATDQGVLYFDTGAAWKDLPGLIASNAITDAQIAAGPALEIGMMAEWGGSTGSVPTNYLLCDGSAVSRTTYALLFAAIGSTHGAGNGTTTFNLPDSLGRSTIGAGSAGSGLTARSPGAKVGEETHLLIVGEMPVHSHLRALGNTHVTAATAGYTSGGTSFFVPGEWDTVAGSSLPFTATAGSGAVHNNMQPSLAVPKIIRAL